MKKGSPQPASPRAATAGLTLFELMLSVAIIGTLGAITVNAGIVEWRREQANAAAMDFTAWLEPISQSPERSGVSCVVTLTTGSALAPGSVLATVAPTTCSTQPSLRLPGINQSTSYSVGATNTSWTFTPRSAITTATGAGVTSTNTDISVRFSVGSALPVRCVRLSGTLGLFRFGGNNASGDTSVECTNWSRS
jgi:Tfp pilus assembly protein PilE